MGVGIVFPARPFTIVKYNFMGAKMKNEKTFDKENTIRDIPRYTRNFFSKNLEESASGNICHFSDVEKHIAERDAAWAQREQNGNTFFKTELAKRDSEIARSYTLVQVENMKTPLLKSLQRLEDSERGLKAALVEKENTSMLQYNELLSKKVELGKAVDLMESKVAALTYDLSKEKYDREMEKLNTQVEVKKASIFYSLQTLTLLTGMVFITADEWSSPGIGIYSLVFTIFVLAASGFFQNRATKIIEGI